MCSCNRKSGGARARLLLALAFSALVSACIPYELKAILDGPNGSALSISPAAIVVPGTQSVSFAASGGVGPYTYALVSGGGTIDAAGLYTAPAPAGTATVCVTDKTGKSVSATITILTVSTSLALSPAAITIGIGHGMSFAAIGGTPPYFYAMQTSGSGAPSVNAAGAYVAGATPGIDVVRVTDSALPIPATSTATVTVTPLAALSISPSTLTLSVGGNVTFSANGGTPPYTFAMQASGSGTPAINPATGYYVAGSLPGADVVRLTDSPLPIPATATASVTVSPPTSVDYTIVAPTTLPAAGTVWTAMPGGSFTLKNIGAGAGTQIVDWNVYLSTNTVLDGGDMVVASGTAAALSAGGSALVPVAGSFPPVAPGPYYLIAQVSCGDDTTPLNNIYPASPVTLSPRSIDYVVTVVNHATGTIAGGAVTGDFTVHNAGGAGGNATIYWTAYASLDTTLDAGDYLLARGNTGFLGSGGSTVGIPFSGTWPSTPGTWYLIVTAAAFDDINHGNDATASGAVVTTGAPPANVDYIVAPATVLNTGTSVAGKPLTGTFRYRNTDTDSGARPVYWTAYLSLNATLEVGTDIVIDSGSVPFLAATTTSGTIPFAGTWSTAGTWYLIIAISASDDLVPGNNVGASAFVTVTPPDVNYNVASVNNSGGTIAGDPLSGTFTFHNGGAADGSQTVAWTAYLSTNTTLEIGTDIVIDSGTTAPLATLAVSGAIAFAGTWPSTPGPWYIVIGLTVAEDVNAGNNTGPSGVLGTTAPNVDYRVFSAINTGSTTAGGLLGGTIVLRNYGAHAGTQWVPWRVYLSTNTTLEIGTDTLIASGFLPSPGLAAVTSSGGIPFPGTWPVSATSGNYYFVVEVDAGDDVLPGNNVGSSAVIPVTPPNVEYVVSSVTNLGGLVAGGALSGNFRVHNNGTVLGTVPINWIAHYSTNAVLDVTDPVIATGSIAAVAGGGDSALTPFGGTWPVTAGTWFLIVEISAADDTNTANNATASIGNVLTAPSVDYNVTAVPPPVGSTTGQAVTGTITIQNNGTADGGSLVYWQVYASLGNNTYDAGDVLLDAGSFAGLPAAGSSSPAYGGTWPSTAGTYYIIARAWAADDATVGQMASGAKVVSNPPPPDYAVSFNAAIPWSGLVNTAMSLTGTCQITIQNMTANPGTSSITWAVYLSTDDVLDGGDTLVQQGSIGALGALASTPVGFAGTWPVAPGKFYYLIATIHAADDANPVNDLLPSHAVAIGDYRYQEGAENNSSVGPSPGPNTSNTATTFAVTNKMLVIEGVMDAFNQYDTYRFITTFASGKLYMRALWGTGFDDIDLYLWDTGPTNLSSLGTALDSEPGGQSFGVTGITPDTYYVGANFYLANNTSGSTGKKYVILVNALP